ncbi:hypothetical protein V5799_008475, partial [Amblyomma americanum]
MPGLLAVLFTVLGSGADARSEMECVQRKGSAKAEPAPGSLGGGVGVDEGDRSRSHSDVYWKHIDGELVVLRSGLSGGGVFRYSRAGGEDALRRDLELGGLLMVSDMARDWNEERGPWR